MLTKVDAYNTRGEMLSLPLQDISGGFIIEDIDGLDPVKATIVSSQFATIDGEEFQSASREKRNILMKLGIEPDYMVTDVRSLRSHLYRFFMPKSQITLKFFNDDVHFVDIDGRVESCDATPFTKEPQMDISILCFKPDFVAPVSTVVPGNTVATSAEMGVTYQGSVETGFVFQLNVNRTMSGFTLYVRPPGGTFQAMEFVASLVAGDTVEISTVSRSKYARLTRGGVQSSLLYAVSPTAAWPQFFPGDNAVRVQAEGAAVPYTITYTAKYGGL